MFERDDVIVANSKVTASESFAHETVVIHFERGTYFSLRGSAGLIWSLLQVPTSISAIVDAVQAQPRPAPIDFESGLRSFIASLGEEGLLTRSSEVATQPTLSAGSLAVLADAPKMDVYKDLMELIAMDPIHEVDAMSGWPEALPAENQVV